ncbi:MAG: type II secretion system protein [Candidatus Gracilibacteria bacterium]|nr:type II secretion system protein [Candidatus Gracilibacteria bacterium]
MNSHKTKAFTLVELIIVITIVSILATIGFISYQQYTNEARDGNRIATLKTVHKGLTISYIQKQTYTIPDDYIDIVGVSKQGYIGDTVAKSIRGEGFKDPKDNTRYLYSLDSTGKKIELSGFLENKDKIKFQSNTNLFINQAFAENIDYTSRYIYTIGDNVGILLNSTTNAPVNETISTGSIDLTTNTGTYIAVFSDTGSISGTGEELLTNISIIQNSCVLGNTVVTNGGQINSYNTTSVAYDQTCTPVSRTCNAGILSGDISYKYDTCSPVNALNCSATTYNGYSIPVINHSITQSISKAVTGGTSNIDTTCTNGALSYGTENVTCSTNYTLTGNSCIANTQNATCGTIPANSSRNTATNITQTWNGSSWLPNSTTTYNATASTTDCTFKCNINYTWNGSSCVANTQTYTCTGLPTNAIWNSVSSYIQTWNGSSWSPTSTTATYNTTTSATSCNYKCNSGYYGTTCLPLTSFVNYSASTNILYTNTAAVIKGWSPQRQIVRRVQVPYSGTLRMQITGSSNDVNYIFQMGFFKNGVIISPVYSRNYSKTFTYDMPVTAGDYISVQGHTLHTSGINAGFTNFYIMGSYNDLSGIGNPAVSPIVGIN